MIVQPFRNWVEHVRNPRGGDWIGEALPTPHPHPHAPAFEVSESCLEMSKVGGEDYLPYVEVGNLQVLYYK